LFLLPRLDNIRIPISIRKTNSKLAGVLFGGKQPNSRFTDLTQRQTLTLDQFMHRVAASAIRPAEIVKRTDVC
jgi:hypothetical protein